MKSFKAKSSTSAEWMEYNKQMKRDVRPTEYKRKSLLEKKP